MQGPNSKHIENLFADISKSYDSANDAFTFGMHRSWKKKLVEWSGLKPGERVLDLATGTGDLAFDFYNAMPNPQKDSVIGADFCEPMLEVAREKALKQKASIEFLKGDACDLQFDDETFDVVSISYGIRNVEHPEKAIQEMYRVLKPGGRLLVLETGSQNKGILAPFIQFYSTKLMPFIGGMVSGKKSAYDYLSKSSSLFPSGEKFVYFIKHSAPFENAEYKSLMGGASFLYKAVKSTPHLQQ